MSDVLHAAASYTKVKGQPLFASEIEQEIVNRV